MAKKCEQCGAPAVDTQSLFCNICGGYVRDEPEPSLIICRACGIPAPDDQSVFCTRCGQKYAADTEDRYPICSSCGSVVPDEQAVFCNRCGTKISSGPEHAVPVAESDAPVSGIQALLKTAKKSGAVTAKKSPGSVIVTKKKHPASPPAQVGGYVPDVLPLSLDPPDDRTEEALPEAHSQKKYAYLPLVADESAADTRPSKNQPAKKYAHLPLIADELKVKDTPQAGFFSNGAREPSPSHQKKDAPKKGIMGMFKR
ncbi:MAG TPA: zinc ribbon domain-containing protein [Methanoregula sp.]|nr:zinc ribbon domain-containing protein [Methanoregula sp.]